MGLLDSIKSYFGGGAGIGSRGCWNDIGGTTKTLAGVTVTDQTALTLPVYWACIRAISEDVAKLPLIVYRRNGRAKERATDNPAYNTLHNSPTPLMTAQAFRETMTSWAVGWGNAYAEISINGRGAPVLYPVHPARVTVEADRDSVQYIIKGKNQHDKRTLPSEKIIHIHGMSFDGIIGASILQYAQESIGFNLATQKFGASFFGNGGNGGTVLRHPNKLSEPALANLRESWERKYSGPENGNRPIILEEGMDVTRLAIPPEEAQFLETRHFGIEEVCRWFRVPPYKVQHLLRAQGWSTLDATNTDYVTDTLMPWLVRWEQEINRKLFPDNEVFAEHLVTGLLRGDMTARSNFYRSQWGIGALSVNDIREAENMNPVEDGDTYFVPSNMTPIELAARGEVNSGRTA